MNKNKINLVATVWVLFQFIAFIIYISTSSMFGMLFCFIFWQILTESGYFLAFKLGFHSTPEGRSVFAGGGSLPFPDFIENSESYLNKRMSLTNFERIIRIVFALSFAELLFIYIFLGFYFMPHPKDTTDTMYLIYGIIFWILGLLLWRGYQHFFAYVFRLEIAWKENNRPFFVKSTSIKRRIK